MSFVTQPTQSPRVRIAPSPTGDPHVGTAYIALFNRIFAQQHGGQFILRIEDTDQRRSTRASEEAIFRALSWLGLTWDEGPDIGGPYGPYRQSERTEIYREHAEMLVEKGEAYLCFATPEELAEMRATQKERGAAVAYDRRYRDLSEAEIAELKAAGRPYVIRLKMPLEGEMTIQDGLRGPITFQCQEIDDQILLKSDGFPTYHLANVVDDHLMKISHVIRAEEWIPSTPKHVRLYEAFGWEAPTFIHMPLLRNADRSKISKRKNPVSLDYYRDEGILPEALLNFLGRMGWSMPNDEEKFTYDEMKENFSWDRLSLGGPIFDLEKLDWLNGLYIRELDDAALVSKLRDWLLSDHYLGSVVPLYRERITRLGEFIPRAAWLFGAAPLLSADAYLPKKRDLAETREATEALLAWVDAQSAWDKESIEAGLRALPETIDWKMRDLFHILRLALTGVTAAPSLFDSVFVLGKSRTQDRLRAVLEILKKAQ